MRHKPPPPVEIDIIEIFEHDPEVVRLLKEIARTLRRIEHEILPTLPSTIVFKETPMLAPVAGNTLVYTGTLTPVGALYPADTTFALVSSDPTVTPTVDSTGLVVTIPLPSTFVDNPASPFNVGYTALSTSNPGWTVVATITPSIPSVLPTGISFVQTS